MLNDNLIEKEQELKLINRTNFSLTGVKKVISFNNHEFVVETNNGPVHIVGENLELSTLDLQNGIIRINGKISSFSYVDKYQKKKEESFLAKIFK